LVRKAKHQQAELADDTIEPGRRMIRLEDKGQSLSDRLLEQLNRLSWRTPLHKLRLRGRHPLKLLVVPEDPVAGNAALGKAMIEGVIHFRGEALDMASYDFGETAVSPSFYRYLHSFAFLRDLNAGGPRVMTAPIAEAMMSRWLDRHGQHVSDSAWRADIWGWRVLFMANYAPLILSSTNLVYRSAVLNVLARGARHLERTADKVTQGPARIIAWAGVVAGGLLIHANEQMLRRGEIGLARALATGISADGGVVTRSPLDQLELVELLSMLRSVYDARRDIPPEWLTQALSRAVPALMGITMGDGALSCWQGSGPIAADRIEAAIKASAVIARPQRQSREWGYQRMAAGGTIVVMDGAPPPMVRYEMPGCASTLALELSDGPHRLVINCGGAGGCGVMAPGLADGLRTTAAHSTLVVADSNSTALHHDGSLGRGVAEVELQRQELEQGSRIEGGHDGYARRYGFVHRRFLSLSSDGKELRGEDVLVPTGKRRPNGADFAIRFHLAPGIEVTPTADGLGALLRVEDGPLWQFRCRGGTLAVDDSIAVDASARPRQTQQLVISGNAPAGGASVSWLFRRAG
jgi:uncharacterized heparinase superfamily protein